MPGCKEGDMAMTHSAPMDNGLLVEVVEYIVDHPTYGKTFRVRSLGSPFHFRPDMLKQEVWWPDANMTPIGKPGDDAVDQFARTLEVAA